MKRVALVLVLPLLVVLVGVARAEPPTVEVPRVLGLRVEEAMRKLRAAGLETRVLGPERGEGVRVVTAQDPAPGETARLGRQVRLVAQWVDRGETPPAGPAQRPRVRVPRLIGLDPDQALARLRDAGLGGRAIGPTHGDAGAGYVTAQEPDPGRVVRRGSRVRLTWRFER